MKPEIKAKRSADKMRDYGCLLVFVGVCVFGYLAYSVRGTYAWGAVALVAALVFLGSMGARREEREVLELLREVFGPSGLPLPRLKVSNSYGWSTFTLWFPTEADIQRAKEAGCITAFKQAIQARYEHTGRKKEPFDVDRAVCALWEGYPRRSG